MRWTFGPVRATELERSQLGGGVARLLAGAGTFNPNIPARRALIPPAPRCIPKAHASPGMPKPRSVIALTRSEGRGGNRGDTPASTALERTGRNRLLNPSSLRGRYQRVGVTVCSTSQDRATPALVPRYSRGTVNISIFHECFSTLLGPKTEKATVGL